MKYQNSKISSNATKLQELSLPFLEVILEEIFLVPPTFLGATALAKDASIADLIRYSGIKEDEVKRKLRQLVAWSHGIMIPLAACVRLHAQDPEHVVLLDIRCDVPFPDKKLPFALRLHPEQFISLYHECKNAEKTLVIFAETPERAFSAALYCKEQGLEQVFALELF